MASQRRRHLSVEEVIAEIVSDDDEDNDLDNLSELVDIDNEEVDDGEDGGMEDAIEIRRVQRTRRLVNCIDAALDPDNFEQLQLPQRHFRTFSAKLGPANSRDAEQIFWTDKPPGGRGRQRRSGIITTVPGIRRQFMRQIDTPRSVFDLFISPTMIATIVESTNRKIDMKVTQIEPINSKTCHLCHTTELEMYAFIGLIYLRGLLGMNDHRASLLFSDKYGHHVFSGTMSKNRFCFLMACLTFDDERTRNERWPHDRFAAFRDIFEQFNENCTKPVNPSEFLSLDETLYPMRHQISFKQYNPSKPNKYGLLFKSLNDGRFSYTYQSIVYAGKPTAEPSEHYVQGNENYVKCLITKTKENLSLDGRNISMDRLYTSIPLARWLSAQNLTVIGTLQSNRIGIPKEIVSTDQRDNNSTQVFWERDEKDLNITSYVVQKSGGKRNILVLSTMQPLPGITRDDGKKKPAVIKLYDFTKGGTDVCDQRMASYSTKPKSRKWTIVAFSYILDVTRINVTTVHALKEKLDPKKIDSFEFGWTLAESLLLPFVRQRQLTGLSQATRMKIHLIRGQQTAPELPSTPLSATEGQRRRCHQCLIEIQGEDVKNAKIHFHV